MTKRVGVGQRSIAVVILSCAVFGQGPSKPHSFEVASVKPSTGQSGGTRSTRDGIVFYGATLRYCVGFAYGVHDFQISAPGWLGDLEYHIVAKMAQPGSARQKDEMLQTLVADLFKLRIHREKKEFPGFALMLGVGGLKLPKPVDTATNTNNNNDAAAASNFGTITIRRLADGSLRVTGEHATMALLAGNLTLQLGVPVVDLTNTAGGYNFAVELSQDDLHLQNSTEGDAPSGISVFSSVRKLGLLLKAHKILLDFIVVDHAEKIPSDN